MGIIREKSMSGSEVGIGERVEEDRVWYVVGC